VSKSQSIKKVSIRPGVSFLSILAHLNYRPWFALAEFVDNSIQSYLDHEAELKPGAASSPPLRVEIEVNADDGGQITIRDNAGGIALANFPRAFRPAEVPPDITGLCEFGIGMKSAAFWFAPRWSVRTSAIGEHVERQVNLDLDSIIEDKLEELDVIERPAKPAAHYTEIILRDLHQVLQTRTLAKIHDHLSSIYRGFIRKGVLELRFKGERLAYNDAAVLRAPYFKEPSGKPRTWRKNIAFDLGNGFKVAGFAALFEVGSTSRAGFALLRRGRLIQGSADEAYRPPEIFGNPNDYAYQRLFGELELEGFEVSPTKDGLLWEDHEEAFLEILRKHLDEEPLPLLKQADGHRVRPKTEDFILGAAKAADKTSAVIQRFVPPIIQKQQTQPPETKPAPVALPQDRETASIREITVHVNNVTWLIRVEMTADAAVGEWLSLSDTSKQAPAPKGHRLLGLRLSLNHPFMQRFAGATAEKIEPFLRIAAALGLAETTARDSGVKSAGTVRRNLNDLLRNAFSEP
jgi:hypothetical protein